MRLKNLLEGLVALSAVSLLGPAACSEPSEAPAGPGAQQVVVTADDWGWTTSGTGSLRTGWVSITFETLEGEADHSLQLIRFKNRGTIERSLEADDEAFLEMAEPLGGFVGVTGAETLTMTVRLDAGSYGMIDFGGTHEGGPNFLRGMTASFEVGVGGGTAGIQPDSDGEIVLREFAIDLPDDFTGRGTYLVRNGGALLHELDIGRLPAGADAGEEVRRQAETGQGSIAELPGLATLSPGAQAYFELDLSSRSYVFVCFIELPPDEEPHALKGMFTPPITLG